MKKPTTVQRVYNTRRSARLMEKKCADTGAIQRERTQPVKIDLFLDEASATSEEDLCNLVSEKSSASGSSSIGTSHELDVSSENIKDRVAEGSVESCDVGISKSTVEGMCNAFEKLDVLVVDGNDQISRIQKILPDTTLERPEEKADCCDELDILKVKSVENFEQHEIVDLEDRQNVDENLVLNDFDTSKDWNGQVHKLKPDLEGLSYSCEDEDLEENLMAANEKIDPDEATIVLVNQHNLTTENILHVDSTFESGEKKVNCRRELGSINVTSAEIFEQQENVYLEERWNVGENIVLNEVGTSDSEENSGKKDNLKPDSDIISSSYEDGDLEEKSMVGNIQNLKIRETLSSVVSETKDEILVCNGSTVMAVDFIHSNSENPSDLSKLDTPENDNVAKDMAVEGAIGENIFKNTADAVLGDLLNPDEQQPSVDFGLLAEEEYDNIIKISSDIAFKNIEDNVAEGGDESCDVGILKAKVEGMCNAFEKLDVFVVDESDEVSTIQKTLPNTTLESGEEVDCCAELDSSKVKSVEHFERHESLELEDRQSVGENFVLNELGSPDSEEKFRHINNLKPYAESIYSYSEDGDLKEKLMVGKIQNSKLQETLPDATLESGEEEVGCCDELDNSKLKSVEHFEGHENADLEDTQNVVEKIVPNEVVTSEERSSLVDKLKLDLEIVSYLSEDGGSEKKLIFADKKVDSNEALNVSVNEQILTTEKSMHVDSTFEIVDHYENVGEKFAPNEVDNPDSEENSGQIDNLKNDSESISSSCEDGDLEEKLMVVEKSNLNEASNISVEQENAFVAPKEHPDSFLSEANVINTEAILFETQNPSDATSSEFEDMFNVVSQMKSETMELNGSTNMAGDIIHLNSKSSSELSKLDHPDNQSVAKEMTEEGIEENIFTSTADAVLVEYMNPNEEELSMDFGPAEKEHDNFSKSPVDAVLINNVNPMEQELAMSFEAPPEEQKLFTGDTIGDTVPTNHEELNLNSEQLNELSAEKTFVEEENQFSRDTNDVIDHPTDHLSIMKQETLSVSPTSLKGMAKARNNDENSDRPTSLNETSLRQLKKQLKALSIKSIDTNKDDMVAEARPAALQAVCDNQLATGEDN